ncbi:MAG: hypothetical protein ACOYNY_44335 [Caldilineaceae bacterium]
MPTIPISTISSHFFALLILCIVVEIALAPIFEWRLYLSRYEGSSYIHPLTIVVTLALLWWYNIDIVGAFVAALGIAHEDRGISEILTTVLVMFGSQGVLRIFNFFSLRNVPERRDKTVEARSTAGMAETGKE